MKKKYNYWYYYCKVTYNNSTSNHYIFDFFLNTFGSSGWQGSIAGDCDDDGYMVSSTAEVSMGSKCRCIDTATPEVSMRKGMNQISSPIDLELSCVLQKHPKFGRACPHGSSLVMI